MKAQIEIFAEFSEKEKSRVYIKKMEFGSDSEVRSRVTEIMLSLQKIYEEPIRMEAKISFDSFTMENKPLNEARQ